MGFETKPNLTSLKYEQFSGETLNLSGITTVYGDIKYGGLAPLNPTPQTLASIAHLPFDYLPESDSAVTKLAPIKDYANRTVVLTNGSGTMTSVNNAFRIDHGIINQPAYQFFFYVYDQNNELRFIEINNLLSNSGATINNIYKGYYTDFVSSVWTGTTGTYEIHYMVDNVNEDLINTITSNRSLVLGTDNVVRSSDSIILGRDNTINVVRSLVVGNNNNFTVRGQNNIFAASLLSNDDLWLANSIVLGNDLTSGKGYNITNSIIGANASTIRSGNIISIGNNHNVNGDNSFSFGRYTQIGWDWRTATVTSTLTASISGDYTGEFKIGDSAIFYMTTGETYSTVAVGATFSRTLTNVQFSGGSTILTWSTTYTGGQGGGWGVKVQNSGRYGGAAGIGTSTRLLLAAGYNSFNISENTASQTSGHGALASNSVILGGINHNIPYNGSRSVIIGGNAIKGVTAITDTVYMPKVRIGLGTGGSLTTDNAQTNFVVRDASTGELKLRALSTFSGSSAITSVNNGLTQIGLNAVLGGSLTGNTTITTATGSRLNIAGWPMQYSTDLSSNFSPRSLVDKGYVTGTTHARVMTTLNIGGSVTINLSNSDMFLMTLTGNVTSFNYSNERLGKDYYFIFIKGTTEYTLTWTAGRYAFPFGSAPTLTNPTTNGTSGPTYSRDIITALCTESGRLAIVFTPDLIKN